MAPRRAAAAASVAVLLAVVVGGCSQPAPSAPVPAPGPTALETTVAPAPARLEDNTGAATVLAGATVTVGGVVFSVELADEPATRTAGLSGRESLPAGTGMLFSFEEPAARTFWMPDMAFALDIAWIADGEIVGVDLMTPCVEEKPADCRRWVSPGPVDAALEVPAGALDGVTVGTPVELSSAGPGPS